MVCPAEQWLQFDVGPPTLVTGVVTKGRGDGRKKHWVTEYRLSYSNDSRLWHFYKDEPRQDIKVGHSDNVRVFYRLLDTLLSDWLVALYSG